MVNLRLKNIRITVLKITFLLVISLSAQAQPTLLKANGYYPYTQQIKDFKSADLNGNGRADLVVVTGHELGVMIYWNQGNGQFTQSEKPLHTGAAQQALLADFDGDGDIDFWVSVVNQGGTFIDYTQPQEPGFNTSPNTYTLADTPEILLINDGTGQFAAQPPVTLGDSAVGGQYMYVQDLDQDGDPDVLKVQQQSDHIFGVYSYQNNGSAGFIETTIALEFLRFVVVADYNNDGHVDLWTLDSSIAADNTQHLAIYLNDRQGQFSQEHKVLAAMDALLFEYIGDVLVADVDADGDVDVVMLSGNKNIITLLQQPDGSFTKNIQFLDVPLNRGALLDFNGDKFVDLVVSSSGGSDSNVLLNQNGIWQPAEHPLPSTHVRQLLSGDFGTGPAVVTVGEMGVQHWQYAADGWSETIQAATASAWKSKSMVGTADMNADGHLDMLVAGINGAYFRAGNGRGNFAEEQLISQREVQHWAWQDVNGDGLSDVMLADFNSVYFYLNTGDSDFAEQLIFTSNEPLYMLQMMLQDFNHDGQIELLLLVPNEGLEVYRYAPTGFQPLTQLSGGFTQAYLLDNGMDKPSIIAGCVDCSADAGGQLIEYYLTATGLQANRSIVINLLDYSLGFSPAAWAFDYDNDGDIDLLLNQSSGFGGFLLVENQDQSLVLSNYYFPSSIDSFPKAMGDFNLDGNVDFITALKVGLVGWQDTLLLNEGENNNHWQQHSIDELALTSSMHTADIDGDGDLDLLTLNLDYLLNTSQGGISTFINTTIDQDFSGQWYDPEQSGHGLQVEEIISSGLPHVNLAWYVYMDGSPVWLTGAGPINDSQATVQMAITSGPGFGSAYNPEDLSMDYWGTVKLTLTEQHSMQFEWASAYPGFSSGAMQFDRLSVVQPTQAKSGELNSCHSTSWYDPAASGHGFMTQVVNSGGLSRLVLTWFTYLDGEQFWLTSAGPIIGNKATLQAQSSYGAQFPPEFDSSEVLYDYWGTVEFELLDDDHAKVSWQPELPGFTAGTMQLQRLTYLDRYRCP